MKLIRLDEDHFAYLVGPHIRRDDAESMRLAFEEAWPGKVLLVAVMTSK